MARWFYPRLTAPTFVPPEPPHPEVYQQPPNQPNRNIAINRANAISGASYPSLFFTNIYPTTTLTFSHQSISIEHTQVIPNKSLTTIPAITEPKTIDKWGQPTNPPPKDIKRLQYLYDWYEGDSKLNTQKETIYLDKWAQPTNLPPKDIKRQQFIYDWWEEDYKSQTQSESIFPDKWHPATNQPRFDIKRQQWTYPYLYIDTNQLTQKESPTLNKWVQPTNLPRLDLSRLQHQYPSYIASITIIAAPTTILSTNLPAQLRKPSTFEANFLPPKVDEGLPLRIDRTNQPLSVAQYVSAKSIAPVTLLDIFPVRTEKSEYYSINVNFTQTTYYPSYAFAPRPLAETTTLDKWFTPANEPQRDFRRLQYTYPSFHDSYVVPGAEIITLDKWFKEASQPRQDLRRLQYLYPYLNIDSKQLTSKETIYLDKWLQPTNQRSLDLSRYSYILPNLTGDSKPVPPPETINLDKWAQPTNQPRQDLPRLQHLYPNFIRDVKIIPTVITLGLLDWYKPFAEPRQDLKRLQYLHSTLFNPVLPPEVPNIVNTDFTVITFNRVTPIITLAFHPRPIPTVLIVVPEFTNQLPTDFQRPRWLHSYFVRSTVVPPEIITVDKWYMPASEPVRRLVHLEYLFPYIFSDAKFTPPIPPLGVGGDPKITIGYEPTALGGATTIGFMG